MVERSIELDLPDETASSILGEDLAAMLRPGDVLALHGQCNMIAVAVAVHQAEPDEGVERIQKRSVSTGPRKVVTVCHCAYCMSRSEQLPSMM